MTYKSKVFVIVVIIIVSIVFLIGIRMYKNFWKSFVGDKGTVHVSYVDMNIDQLICSIDSLYKAYPELRMNDKNSSTLFIIVDLKDKTDRIKVHFRVIGGSEYLELYHNRVGEQSTLSITPEQSILEFFAPYVDEDIHESIRNYINTEFIVKLKKRQFNCTNEVYNYVYESNSEWIKGYTKNNGDSTILNKDPLLVE